jgi:hypothetical protein
MIAQTLGEHASLWAIRLALLLLSIVMCLQVSGLRPTDRRLAIPWMIGAVSAGLHSIGALMTFHHGSQLEALRSTAEQTKELIGISFAAGLYFNYVFVAAWLFDATMRLVMPKKYSKLPNWYSRLILGFLAFIAFNGVVVFKTGLLRYLGIGVTMFIVALRCNHRYQECFFRSSRK